MSQCNRLLLNFGNWYLAIFDLRHTNGELDPRQHRFGEMGDKLDIFRLETAYQYFLNLQAQFGVVDITREERQAVHKLAIDILPHEDPQHAAFLDVQNVERGTIEFIRFYLEQFITRVNGENLVQFLSGIVITEEPRPIKHLIYFPAQQRNLIRAFLINP